MTTRRGVSLVNVMVFMLFVIMLTAQVFFFTENAFNEAADELELMEYRVKLDSILKKAENVLKKGEEDKLINTIVGYADFYKDRIAKELKEDKATATIYDLDYTYDNTNAFDKRKWQTNEKKVFAAMPPHTVTRTKTISSGDVSVDIPVRRYYLIRAWVQLPENFYNTKLMYQVLVSRDNEDDNYAQHTVDIISFQEVWF